MKRTLHGLEVDRVGLLLTIDDLTVQVNESKSLTDANAFIPKLVKSQLVRERMDAEIKELAEQVVVLYSDYNSPPASEQVLEDRLIKSGERE